MDLEKKDPGLMNNEILSDGHSLIHRLAPEAKIVVAFLLSVATALSKSYAFLGGYFCIALVLAAMAWLPVREVLKRLKPLLWFLLMIWALLPLTFEGEIFLEAGFVTIYQPGIRLCIEITIKSVAILILFMALLATMPVAGIGQGLHKLKMPDKLVFLLLMTYRYIFVIKDEYTRLLRAARFRGFVPGTNLHSYRTFAYLAGMLFVRASFRARRVHQAMICRGFHGRFHSLDIYPYHLKDTVFMILMGGMTVLLFTIEKLRMPV